jgi:hypothetical protein
MDEELIPIAVIGLALAAVLIKATSGYTQGQMAGLSAPGYDITQKESPIVIPLSKTKGGLPPPPVPATKQNLSTAGTQMPYGVVPADVRTDSLIDHPARVDSGGSAPGSLSGPGGQSAVTPSIKDLGPTSLSNPNTPPDVKTMLANAPPDF